MRKKLTVIWTLMILLLSLTTLNANAGQPIAQFKFEKDTYQLGEMIKPLETSYSLSGEKIVQRQWMIIKNGNKKTSSYLSSLVDDLKIGEQEIFLRVKDEQGIWSAWTSQKVKIRAADPIELTKFTIEQESLAKGEKINFVYEYNNPNDINIVSQKWRYKNITTNGSTISGKPKYFKKAGTYEVSLEVQDEWGNWSNQLTCLVKVTEEQIKRNGYYLFQKGRPGDLIAGYIDKDYNALKEVENVSYQDLSGALIMSNSPESIPSSGILYKDEVNGIGRLLIHHKNATEYNKKLMIIATTTEVQPVTVKVNNEAMNGPSHYILESGQASVRDYLKGSTVKQYSLKAGETLCIYDSSKEGIWKSEQIISGTLDFQTSAPVTFAVIAIDEKSNLSYLSSLSVLPDDGVHIRGTFPVIKRIYEINIANVKEATKLVLGREQEEWLEGKDALTGQVVKNKGNYGLPIVLKVNSEEDIGVILNARGGGFLGSVRWQNQVFDVPREDILTEQKVAALIGVQGKNETNELVYMLPNGSSAPVLIGFIPKALWD